MGEVGRGEIRRRRGSRGGGLEERTDFVGEEAVEELGGVGTAEADHGAGPEAAGHGSHLLQARGPPLSPRGVGVEASTSGRD